MLVVLSGGLLTAMTGTAVLQVQPVLADKDEECEENDDFNCNEETQKINQEDSCKIVNEIENDDSNNNSNDNNGNGEMTCWNFAQNPEDGDAVVNEFPPDPFAPTVADTVPSDPFAATT